jgi:mannonate dehydratase
MKLGFGLYRNMLTAESLRFARQVGATHIVAHPPGSGGPANDALLAKYGRQAGHGLSDPNDPLWTYDGLRDLKALVNSEGLELEALENFAPSMWYDVLLDGPRRAAQMERLKQLIRDMGKVGIPIMGYYFSVAGVWGQMPAPNARGQAVSVGFDDPPQPPIPAGMVWNMVYDTAQFDPADTSRVLAPVSDEEIRGRFRAFINEMVPVAEEAGVKLALHPDDPPMPQLRGAHRLSYTPDRYAANLDVNPSPANTLELCLGTVAEMAEGDIYSLVEKVSAKQRIGYIHFRNVRGKVPHYKEVFIDEGDTDMIRILRILHRNHYDGVLIPDHTPLMECAAPWQAGMAFAMGWMKAALALIEQGGA